LSEFSLFAVNCVVVGRAGSKRA